MFCTNPVIVKKVSIPDTLRALSAGVTAAYARTELGSYAGVYSAVLRLNNEAGFKEYDLDISSDGAAYIITRNPQNR